MEEQREGLLAAIEASMDLYVRGYLCTVGVSVRYASSFCISFIFFIIILRFFVVFFGFNVYFCRRSYRKNTVFIQLQHEFYM